MAKGKTQKPANGSNIDFEAQLWASADIMPGYMDASEYKHVCLGLIFLKYIFDAFEEKREQLLFGFSDPKSEWFNNDEPGCTEAAENRDEYLATNVFWLPPEARWRTIKAKATPPFNMSNWGGENLRLDVRWKYGIPPVNNANYAWIQHFIHHLSPVGVAGFVMANGSMSTQTSNGGDK